jgi:hypothetical protein
MKKKRELDLSSGFTCSVDTADENQWNSIIPMFRDATVNQTWSFGASISGKVILSHLVLKKNDENVGACQTRIKTLSSLRFGIAFVACGPMWQLWNRQKDLENLRQIIRALRTEYVHCRKLFLMIRPNTYDCEPDASAMTSIFEDEGFHCSSGGGRTLMIDLSPSLEELRKGLHQKWRNQLNCAEKNNLQIYVGCDYDLFTKFKKIYEEMLARKKYADAVDIDNFERIQNELPHSLKPRVVICQSNGETMAGAVFSIVGDTAFYFLGATSNNGTKTKASYLVQWSIIKWLKEHGYCAYDLGGISPKTTPETYHFKVGMCGKNENNGKDTRRIGEFTACESPINSFIIKNILRARDTVHWLKSKTGI